ncbi:hypothetical protein CGOTTB_03285 [Corynebacterium gottingense]|nr:hypothetical protein CGOTTB_03285 [Corynebacterium gottingense]
MDEAGGELHALLVTQREVIELVVQTLAQAELAQELLAALLGGRAVHAVELGQEDELVEDLLLAVQAALFRHVADAAPRGVVERRAVEQHLAGIGLEHAQRDAHRGGLASAV